jgi:hypothetical protein
MPVVKSLEAASVDAYVLNTAEFFVQDDQIGIVRWEGNDRRIVDIMSVNSPVIPDLTEFAEVVE